MEETKYTKRCMLMLAASALAWSSGSSAATLNAASCAQSNVQSAITSAANGDTVRIPAGSCSWSSAVAWTNKNVAVIGAGKDATMITCTSCFSIVSNVSTSAYSGWRISGMTLRGATPNGGAKINIWDNIGSWHYGWRIDNIRFDYPGQGSGYGVSIGGATYGLIDHNEFNWGGGLAIIIMAQMSDEYPGSSSKPQGGYIASLPLDMGTANAVYIEDNSFTGTAPGGLAAFDTSSGGGRAVFRHNVVTGGIYYSHWTRNVEIGGVLHEIYNNKFVGTSNYNSYPVRLESGTGVIFNNAITGYGGNYVVVDERRGFYESAGAFGACNGTRSWDGNKGDASAPGWPCLGQIGRGPGKSMAQIAAGDKQPSVPLYLWRNGAEDGCRTGGPCTDSLKVSVWDGSTKANAYVRATPHPNGEVDYVLNGVTPKPGYTPYRYPHPLQGGNTQPSTLQSPSNLRVVQ